MATAPSSFHAFISHVDAADAIQALSRSGVDVTKLSLIGKVDHGEEQPLGFYTLGDQIKPWGGIDGFWGGVWAQLLAPAVVLLPGVGLVAMAGPMVPALIKAFDGTAMPGGVSALGAALSHIGMARQDAIDYEDAVKIDNYVLMAHGSDADRLTVHDVLSRTRQGQDAGQTHLAADAARSVEAIGVAARARASESTSALFNGA
jgi:hypothetical protein